MEWRGSIDQSIPARLVSPVFAVPRRLVVALSSAQMDAQMMLEMAHD